MQISVTERHVEIGDSVKDYAREKAARLDRYYDRIETIDVIFDQESTQQIVEMVVRADHRSTFVTQVQAKDIYEALDLAIDKMERQLTRHKEKIRNRKHSGQAGPE